MKIFIVTLLCSAIYAICAMESSSTPVTKLTGKNDKDNEIVENSFYYLTYSGELRCSLFLMSPNKLLGFCIHSDLWSPSIYHSIDVVRGIEKHNISEVYTEKRRPNFDGKRLTIIQLCEPIRAPESQEWMDIPLINVLRERNPTGISMMRWDEDCLDGFVEDDNPQLNILFNGQHHMTITVDFYGRNVRNGLFMENFGGFLIQGKVVIGVAYKYQIMEAGHAVSFYANIYDHAEFICGIVDPEKLRAIEMMKSTKRGKAVVPF